MFLAYSAALRSGQLARQSVQRFVQDRVISWQLGVMMYLLLAESIFAQSGMAR